MPVKLVITIDAEEDSWGLWKTTNDSVDNITRIPIIQDLFDRFGAVPTYLVNYPVATNEKARQIFEGIIDRVRCEIGAHCHPWNTPPFEEETNARNTMMCNLPYTLVHRKLATLHKAIIDGFKVIPVCFRTGRWGFGPQVAKSIHKLGYRVDTSVTPFIDWRDEGGPDFSESSTFPYRFDTHGVLSEKADGCLLEVPATIGFLQKDFRRCSQVTKWILRPPFRSFNLLGILNRLRVVNCRWLSPELSSASEMIRLAKNFILSGHKILNLSFHSTSLLPGKGPFVRNEEEFNSFLKDIELFLEFCVNEGMTFSTLSGAFNVENRR